MNITGEVKGIEFFKALIENSSEMLTLYDEKGDILYSSPANKRILGFDQFENIGKSGFDLVHPDDLEYIKQNYKRVLETEGIPISISCRIKTKLGGYILVDGIATNMMNVKGINAIVFNYHDITKSKNLEHELLQTRNNLRSLINSIRGIVWEADPVTFQFTFVSDYASVMLGYPIEQWKTEHEFWQNHIHPDDKDWVVNQCLQSVKDKTSVDFEYRMIASDGSIVWLKDLVSVVAEDGKPLKLRGIMMDITERHQALEDLAIREHYFKNLIDKSESAVILISAEGKFLYQSPAVEKILGYTVEGESHTNVFDFVHPDEKADFFSAFIELLQTPGGVASGEYRFLHEKGHYVWIEGSVTNLLHDPNINAFIANYQDVSIRKKAQEALEKSEANLQTIFNNADTGYILMDTELNMVSFNHLAQKFSVEDLTRPLEVGKNAIDYFSDNLKAFMQKKMALALSGQTISHELSYPQADGSDRWYYMRFYPLYNFETKIYGIVMALSDVTERKTYELQRKKITMDLLQRNKAQEQFTYIVSHNLRSPVANILGVCQLLQEDGFTDEEKKELMQGLLVSAHKLEEVIVDLNQILQVRKDVRENREYVSFEALVKDAESTVSEWIKNEEVNIITDFTAWEGFVTLKSYINSIFYNLISNSIKYRKPNIPVRIEIRSYLKGTRKCLSFKDNGLGIDLEKKGNQVFGLYKRFHTFVEGRGMGLYMVKTQVETLGGKISVTSKVNEGTEFIIEME